MALDDEKRAELTEDVEAMRMLVETISTSGWQKIILPTFVALRKSYYSNLLNAENVQEMYKAQCAIKSLNVIISDKEHDIESDIDSQIRQGKEAAEALSKEKPEKPEEDKE